MGTLEAVREIATSAIELDRDYLRRAIQDEYAQLAQDPQHGFHFHTGRPLARILGYEDSWLLDVPESAMESFAGTGNPFSLGPINPGDRVVDIGCGAGMDTFIAAKMAGPDGHVVGVDMTPEMVSKARAAAEAGGFENVEICEGFAEALPVPDGWADVVISNGVFNLFPDKAVALAEIARILKPGGRMQFGDILVDRPVSEGAKQNIDLWTG